MIVSANRFLVSKEKKNENAIFAISVPGQNSKSMNHALSGWLYKRREFNCRATKESISFALSNYITLILRCSFIFTYCLLF